MITPGFQRLNNRPAKLFKTMLYYKLNLLPRQNPIAAVAKCLIGSEAHIHKGCIKEPANTIICMHEILH